MVQANENFIKKFLSTKGQKKSYIFMLFSCIFWVSGYLYANEHNFSPIQTNLSRSIAITIGIFIIIRIMNLNIQYKSPKSWSVLLKRHFSFIVQGFVLAGVQFILPLGITHTICAAGPIISLILQKIIFKHGSIHGKNMQGCFIASLGIILTTNGKFLYTLVDQNFQFNSSFENYKSNSYFDLILATFILLVAMTIWSYGTLITQQAESHSFEIIFHFGCTNLLVSSLSYLILPQKRPAQQMYQSLIYIGVFLFIAEICFTLSLNLSQNIGLTNISSFTTVVVGYGISIFHYGQPLEIFSLLGTILVIFGVSQVILNNNNKEDLQQISNDEIDLKQKIKEQGQNQRF